MPRIPYKSDDAAGPRDAVDTIRARRGGRLLNLDRMLLHSPPYALAWNGFLGTVRNGLALPAKLRELAICVVAVANRADYEFHHHAPELAAAGATEAQLAALATPDAAVADDALFDDAERATIRLALEMTREVQVGDDTFAAAVQALGDEQHLVELVGVIACYNMVSRFLVALDVQPE